METETLQITIWQLIVCWISKATRAQAHARARAPTHIHVLTHPRARTYTQICNILFVR